MASFAGIMAFYWPPKKIREERLSWRKAIWSCDPIGSLTLIAGTTLVIMALNWAGATYPWSNVHVVSCLVTGAVLLLAFGFYGKMPLFSHDGFLIISNQNGRVERMVSLHMFSSRLDQILAFRSLRLQLKGTSLWFPITVRKCVTGPFSWIFFSAVNNVIPLIILNLGWETSAWEVSIRQLPLTIATLLSAPFLM